MSRTAYAPGSWRAAAIGPSPHYFPPMLSDKELVSAVQAAAGSDYKVYGELGRETDDRVALLALDRAADALIVLIVTSAANAQGGTDLAVELRTELDAGVPDAGSYCTNCGARLRPWARFCGRCGTDATGRGGTGDTDVTQLRGAVEAAIAAEYDLLGEMHRKEGGGAVFFGRNRATGKIVALRLNRVLGTGEFELDETTVIKKLPGRGADGGVSVSVTQVLRKLDSHSGAGQSGSIPTLDPPRSYEAPPPPPAARPARRPEFDLEPPPLTPPPTGGSWSAPPVRQTREPEGAGQAPAGVARNNGPIIAGLGALVLLGALAWAAMNL